MIFVFIFVCVAITLACNYIIKKNKEKQRQLLEAAELLQKVPDDLVRSMKANEERHTKDQEQLEAFGAKFDALTESEKIRAHEDMYQERITCANGHHFLLADFLNNTNGVVCPICRTSAYTFDDPNQRRFFYCNNTPVGVMKIGIRMIEAQGGKWTDSDLMPYLHWFSDQTDACPLCEWLQESGSEVKSHPLDEIAWNAEKLKAQKIALR